VFVYPSLHRTVQLRNKTTADCVAFYYVWKKTLRGHRIAATIPDRAAVGRGAGGSAAVAAVAAGAAAASVAGKPHKAAAKPPAKSGAKAAGAPTEQKSPEMVLLGDDVFEVEAILDHRKRRGGGLEYLVKWSGYGDAVWVFF
jgi:hypothetical protein